jgi:hypothetical protein
LRSREESTAERTAKPRCRGAVRHTASADTIRNYIERPEHMHRMTKLKNTPKVPARKRTASILIEDVERAALAARQSTYADACKLLAAIVIETRCRDRYALHKLAYRLLRAETPLGSACCNALRRVTGPHRSTRSNGEIARDKLVPAINLRRAGVHFDVRTLTPRQPTRRA